MVMQVTDTAGIYVPRFCYHEKLSIAANCRMCLVEIEKAPKPMPACATPVAEGMKVFTRSPRAIAAQKATMEFLLINHPLDCPICDQGGECELQDLALGFGSASSRFDERKRVVKDKNLGPLISTDMTRCIHCTRCVRFTAEIAGLQELGATGRGEHMEIGTWIERSVDHELSGNVIDLCPVGALNSKPFRHRARSWEMTEHALVSPHDATGTNLYGHVLRGRLMRVVPRHNDEINETWIADRDRFSYEGIYSADRLHGADDARRGPPGAKCRWDAALAATADMLKGAAPTARTGSASLDRRARRPRNCSCWGAWRAGWARTTSTRDCASRTSPTRSTIPAYPGLGIALRDIETLDAPAARRLPRARGGAARRASRAQGGACAARASACSRPRRRNVISRWAARSSCRPRTCSASSRACCRPRSAQRAAGARADCGTRRQRPRHRTRTARSSMRLAAGRGAIILGGVAMRHTRYADLRAAAAALASLTGATLGYLAGWRQCRGRCACRRAAAPPGGRPAGSAARA